MKKPTHAQPEPVIRLLVSSNPKRPGTAAHARFALYRDGMTAVQFLSAGGTRADLEYDLRRGHVKIDARVGKGSSGPGATHRPTGPGAEDPGTTAGDGPGPTSGGGSGGDGSGDGTATGQGKRDALLAKIRALRAKTLDNGCTEAEMMTATAKVGEMMDRYGVTMDELELRSQSCVQGRTGTHRARKHEVDWAVLAIARYCGTVVWNQDGAHHYFGMPHQVEISIYLHEMLVSAMERAFDEYKKSPDRVPMPGGKLRRSFMSAMAGRVTARLDAMTAEREKEGLTTTDGTALVVVGRAIVEEQMAATGISLSAGRSFTFSAVSDAHEAGSAAGDRVGLHTAVQPTEDAERLR